MMVWHYSEVGIISLLEIILFVNTGMSSITPRENDVGPN